jgi:hypothetical protein
MAAAVRTESGRALAHAALEPDLSDWWREVGGLYAKRPPDPATG